VLADGTPFYAPIGEVIIDGARVTCHLCGRSLRSVTVHLRTHGWSKQAYCDAFGLERGQSLEGADTRKLRSAAFTARLIFEPAVREGSAAGRERARRGDLTRAAAAAAKGRPFPEQRRKKASQAMAARTAPDVARTNSDRATRHLAQVAQTVALRAGYEDLGSLVLARIADGASLAAISLAAGLHKDWLSRHLANVDAVAAAAARQLSSERPDARWLPALTEAGFADVAHYLRQRHLAQHQTVNAIAAEIGISNHAVTAALRRHGLAQVRHAAKRHAANRRADQVAAAVGHANIADYVAQRRGQGWTWKAISAESGQPQSWLRRHAARPKHCGAPAEGPAGA
jgi:lambda repressor-like predicted transcriptional regulator